MASQTSTEGNRATFVTNQAPSVTNNSSPRQPGHETAIDLFGPSSPDSEADSDLELVGEPPKRQKTTTETSGLSSNSTGPLSKLYNFKIRKTSDTFYDPRKYELKKNNTATSVVWGKGFKYVYDINGPKLGDVAGCEMCHKAAEEKGNIQWVFKCKSSRTSELLAHLTEVHGIECRKATKSSVAGSVAGSTISKATVQSTLTKSLVVRGNFPEKMVKYIVNCARPIATCEDPDFRNMMRETNPNLVIPDRRQTTKLVTQYADEIREVTRKTLQGKHYAITIDHWTSIAQDNFMALTCHFITADFRLVPKVLGCHKHVGKADAASILPSIKTELERFGLVGKDLVSITMDTAPVNGCLGTLMEEDTEYFGDREQGLMIPCAAHTAQLPTNLAFNLTSIGNEEQKELMKRTRKLVALFKYSTQLSGRLKEVQKQLGVLVPLIVYQDVVTRWWSTYMMIERLLTLKPSLIYLEEEELGPYKLAHDQALTGAQWDDLKLLKQLLEPFMVFQRQLEGDKYVTSSLLFGMVSYVRTIVEGHIATFDLTGKARHIAMANLGRSLLDHKTSGFNVYYGSGDLSTVWDESEERGRRNRRKGIPRLCLIATAVDPRTKGLKGLNDAEKEKVWAAVANEMAAFQDDEQPENLLQEIPQVGGIAGALQDIFDDPIAPVEVDDDEQHDKEAERNAELVAFKRAARIAFGNCPLEWWAVHLHKFPLISKVARKFLCSPVTSASSERVFSVAGRVIEKRRNRLTGANAENLIFLHQNWRGADVYDDDDDDDDN